jgi:hypothetical protein
MAEAEATSKGKRKQCTIAELWKRQVTEQTHAGNSSNSDALADAHPEPEGTCYICKKGITAHHCVVCFYPCHAVPPCGSTDFDDATTCQQCEKKKSKAASESPDGILHAVAIGTANSELLNDMEILELPIGTEWEITDVTNAAVDGSNYEEQSGGGGPLRNIPSK